MTSLRKLEFLYITILSEEVFLKWLRPDKIALPVGELTKIKCTSGGWKNPQSLHY